MYTDVYTIYIYIYIYIRTHTYVYMYIHTYTLYMLLHCSRFLPDRFVGPNEFLQLVACRVPVCLFARLFSQFACLFATCYMRCAACTSHQFSQTCLLH